MDSRASDILTGDAPLAPRLSFGGRGLPPFLNHYLRLLPLTWLVSTLIALFSWVVEPEAGFLRLWVFCLLLGCSITTFECWFVKRFQVHSFWPPALAAVSVCLVAGKLLSCWISHPSLWEEAFVDWEATLRVVGVTLIITPSCTYFSFTRGRLAHLVTARKEADRLRMHQEKLALRTQVQRLQAQVEERLCLTVRDDGTSQRSVVGLETLRKRLQALLDPQVEMQISAGWNGENGVSAELWIPVTQKP